MKSFVLKVLDDIDVEVQMTLDGLSLEQLMWQPAPQSNSIGWLAWHIARLQDARAADLSGHSQLWTRDSWHERFGLDADPVNNGRGHSDAEVAAVRPESADALRDYAHSAHMFLRGEIEKQDDLDSDRVLNGDSGDATVRDLVFRAVHGGLAHSGQLMYVRGLVEKRRWFPR